MYAELPFCREPEQQAPWLRYEAIVNHVFAARTGVGHVRIRRAPFPSDVVDDAWRTHREVHHHGWRENPHYERHGRPRAFARARQPTRSPACAHCRWSRTRGTFRRLLAGELGRGRRGRRQGRRDGHGSVEVLVNAERHGGGLRGLRAGRAGDRFVCEITDAGPGLRRPIRGLQAAAPAGRPRRALDGAADDEATRSPAVGQSASPAGSGSTTGLRAGAASPAGGYFAKRCTNASAVSATSRQPLSIVSACPRPGISTISVTPSLRFCFLNEAFAIAHGTV